MSAALILTWPVAAAVLFGALLHAGWNVLVKSGSDKAMDNALITLLGSLVALPVLLVVGWPAPAAWPFILTSAVIHLGYYTALTGAYKHGDLGLTYPLMRGTAPLLVALSATTTLSETLSPLSWAGVLGVCCGVLALGLSRHALDSPRAVAFALANAVVIAVYTVVDGLGVRASGNALQYVLALFALNGWPFALLVLARRGAGTAWPYARRRWPVALLGGDRVAGFLWHRTVGDDARAGGHGGRAARNIGALRRAAGHLAPEGRLQPAADRRHGLDHGRRDGLADGLALSRPGSLRCARLRQFVIAFTRAPRAPSSFCPGFCACAMRPE